MLNASNLTTVFLTSSFPELSPEEKLISAVSGLVGSVVFLMCCACVCVGLCRSAKSCRRDEAYVVSEQSAGEGSCEVPYQRH